MSGGNNASIAAIAAQISKGVHMFLRHGTEVTLSVNAPPNKLCTPSQHRIAQTFPLLLLFSCFMSTTSVPPIPVLKGLSL